MDTSKIYRLVQRNAYEVASRDVDRALLALKKHKNILSNIHEHTAKNLQKTLQKIITNEFSRIKDLDELDAVLLKRYAEIDSFVSDKIIDVSNKPFVLEIFTSGEMMNYMLDKINSIKKTVGIFYSPTLYFDDKFSLSRDKKNEILIKNNDKSLFMLLEFNDDNPVNISVNPALFSDKHEQMYGLIKSLSLGEVLLRSFPEYEMTKEEIDRILEKLDHLFDTFKNNFYSDLDSKIIENYNLKAFMGDIDEPIQKVIFRNTLKESDNLYGSLKRIVALEIFKNNLREIVSNVDLRSKYVLLVKSLLDKDTCPLYEISEKIFVSSKEQEKEHGYIVK